MSGFPILDLVIGMVFIYFLLSVISSSIVEIVLTLWRARAKVLEQWLVSIFNKEVVQPNGTKTTLGKAIMDHCAAIALSKPGSPPSYIDAKNFTAALLEKITYNPQNPNSIATDINEVIKSLEATTVLSTELKRALLSYAYEARDTYAAIDKKVISQIEYFKSKVEAWYDTTQDRLTGTFKRKWTQPLTFVIAIITTVALNADSIAIANYLYSSPDARAAIAAQVIQSVKDSAFIKNYNQLQAAAKQDTVALKTLQNNISNAVAEIDSAKAVLASDIPVGWNRKATAKVSAAVVTSKITGLLATIFAIFLGAPFWFDILNKVANLRGSGPKPPSSTGSDSNDSKNSTDTKSDSK